MKCELIGNINEKRELVLGGVFISNTVGLENRADGDIISISIANAIIKTFREEDDVDTMFPIKNIAFNQMSSEIMLIQLLKKMQEKKFICSNINIKLFSYIDIKNYIYDIRENISALLMIDIENIYLDVEVHSEKFMKVITEVSVSSI